MNVISLYELNQQVRVFIEGAFEEPVWIQAELSSVSQKGMHCYLEFIQKGEEGNTFVAKARGQVWSRTWTMLRPYFERVTGQSLSAGMQVMVQVEVTFHETYGYSLNVVDINPTFTLGDLARRRQEIIQRLTEEGVIDMNRQLPLPLLLQRVAVVSSEEAAGWGDFRNQLLNNQYGLAFHVQLFPAVMQGERVESTIISALNQIAREQDSWDVVVIIRGGGATSDLTGFDTYDLAENIAQFPLPVITGIGHERDDTVLDLISHTRVKTPTAAAEFLLHHQLEQFNRVNQLRVDITDGVQQLLHGQWLRLAPLVQRLPSLFEVYHSRQTGRIQLLWQSVISGQAQLLQQRRHRLELLQTQLQAASPEHVLSLGYSIVRSHGKAITSSAQICVGDELQIAFHEGTAVATVSESSISQH